MKLLVLCYSCYFVLFCATGGQILGDPAPGRSPGPPGMKTIAETHGGIAPELPTLLLTQDGMPPINIDVDDDDDDSEDEDDDEDDVERRTNPAAEYVNKLADLDTLSSSSSGVGDHSEYVNKNLNDENIDEPFDGASHLNIDANSGIGGGKRVNVSHNNNNGGAEVNDTKSSSSHVVGVAISGNGDNKNSNNFNVDVLQINALEGQFDVVGGGVDEMEEVSLNVDNEPEDDDETSRDGNHNGHHNDERIKQKCLSVSDYLMPNDNIARVYGSKEIYNENNANNEANAGEDSAQNSPMLQLDVTHDVFDTANGLVYGLAYTVTLVSSATQTVSDFYVESTIDDESSGNFFELKGSYNQPRQHVSNNWDDLSEAEWMSKEQHETRDVPPPPLPVWSHEDIKTHETSLSSQWGELPERINNEVYSLSDRSRGDCILNAWSEPFLAAPRVSKLWMAGEQTGRQDVVRFRILYRTVTSPVVFEAIYSFILHKECQLLLKSPVGHLNYTSLPKSYNTDCTVYFPSHKDDAAVPTGSSSSKSSETAGLLVQLTRLNVPCRSGGYVAIHNNDNLCGKLEELSTSERTYYFATHNHTFVKLHKNPLFSLHYKLVDYCYNLTLTDRNGTFFLKPRNTLECYFKVHLPYGNRVELNVITNYMNISSLGQLVSSSSTSSNTRDTSIKHEYLDLSNTQGNSQSSASSSSSSSNFHQPCHEGIVVEIIELSGNSWQHCVNSFSASRKWTLLSKTNTLVIKTTKFSSLDSVNRNNNNNGGDYATAEVANQQLHLPSIYFEYNAFPIADIVSQCAFGWVAIHNYCITSIDAAMNWHQAETECIKIGGHLASIKTDQEQRVIDNLLVNGAGYKDHSAYWVGASDRTFEGDFKWINGFPFTYSNWFPGWSQHGYYNKQPNDDGLSDQDCIEVRRHFRMPPGVQPTTTPLSPSYMWNDRDCNARNYFLCERPLSDELVEKLWTSDCNKTISLSKEHPKASLWSPGFPRPYPDNANCYTTVVAPAGYHIIIEFEELVIESEPDCSYDYLEMVEANQLHLHNHQSSKHFHRNSNFNYQQHNSRHSQSRGTSLRKRYLYNSGAGDLNNNGNNADDNFYERYSNLYKKHASYVLRTPDTVMNLADESLDRDARGSESSGTTDANGSVLPRRMCGDWSSKLKLLRHVTSGPILGLHFVSDYSHHFSGFKARVSMENPTSECSDERLQPYNGSCYLFVSYPEVEWYTAQQVCRGIGAQLASITTAEEQRFVTTSIRNQMDYSPQAIYWLGGELTQNKEFEWTDGTKMSFQGWLPGQGAVDQIPKDPICLGIHWKVSPTPMLPSGLYWISQKCTKFGGYVCKRSKISVTENIVRNQTFNGSEGRLTTPGYPNSYPLDTEYWVNIIAPKRTRLVIQFQKIDLESQDECLYDYVSVQNLDDTMRPKHSSKEQQAAAAAGDPGTNPIPMAMFSPKEINDMDYQSDAAATMTDVVEKNQHTTLFDSTNPIFGNDQSIFKRSINAQEKKYLNWDPRTRRRKKRFMQNNEMFSGDGKSSSGLHTQRSPHTAAHQPSFRPYVRWCGTHEANMSRFNFVSASNQALLHFHSDYSVTAGGFSATWTAIDVSGCPVQTLTSREGTFHSANWPHFLLNNLDCAFIIQAPSGKRVWLEFSDIEIGDEGAAVVEVDVGNGRFVPFMNVHQLNDGVFVSESERMIVRLQTGENPSGRGFQAFFKTMNPIHEQHSIVLANDTNGVLFHLNYPQNVPANIEFTQHLVAPLGYVILLEVYGVGFQENGCHGGASLQIYDNYSDNNGTSWHLCDSLDLPPSHNSLLIDSNSTNHRDMISSGGSGGSSSNFHGAQLIPPGNPQHSGAHAPIHITSYLNTLHVRQTIGSGSRVRLNATVRTQMDTNYKLKLASGDDEVESCHPNPCQYGGKCLSNADKRKCQCKGHFTGRFCALNMCELEPCLFGQCELTATNFKCRCQKGYEGHICDQRQKPCADNPCESRGDCFEKNGGFFCRCHAWWEGQRCERRMMHIPYKPLSERMLQEPFWLGLITVFVVLGVIGLVWCAKRHFPEKIEKLLAEEADRNRPTGSHHHHTSLREQLQFTNSAPQSTATTPGAPRTIFGRLGIRKPSLLSLSSPQPPGGATARTFSLDDLLRPPPRRTPSPRKKRNNSTPTKKNAAEKKQILQQLITPAANPTKPKMTLGELIQLSENRLKANGMDSESDLKETTFSENSVTASTSTTKPINDPKLEKKVTFARLLNKVTADMSSGSEVDIGNGTNRSYSALSLPVDIQPRASSMPPSPCTNDIRSPHSTSSNQGSDSLSGSDLVLSDFGLKNSRRIRPKTSSADSILAMFRNFASTNVTASMPSSVVISPSTTPTASSPQEDMCCDDESSTSSMHTPVSFTSGPPDSPVFYRQSTIEVPVLDPLSAHKSSPVSNLLHPPTILLEIPSNGINKCLSPIREMPTPMPSPALTPIMPRLQRSRTPSVHDDPMSASFSDDDDLDYDDHGLKACHQTIVDLHSEARRFDSDIETTPTEVTVSSANELFLTPNARPHPPRLPFVQISIDIDPPTPTERTPTRPNNLIIPTLIVEHPSPTRDRKPPPLPPHHLIMSFPGSPPPQRASIGETSFMFPNKQQQKRLLKQFDKPTSLDLPFTPPTITITSTNVSEIESDADTMSPAPLKTGHLHVPGNTMCYLSPFSMCIRGDRTISESNLSSSGYSSMASPGPSRCNSNNPLCPNEMEDPGSGPSGSNMHLHNVLAFRRHVSHIDNCQGDERGQAVEGGGNTQVGRRRSDSETYSDDAPLESNDEGIGTDHIEEKIEGGDIKSAKELEMYVGKDLLENGKLILEVVDDTVAMAQLQLPSIIVHLEGKTTLLSPVSSRSSSPLSELNRFSPAFCGRKELPFTDSDGLYDFPSSDGKAVVTVTTTKKACCKRRERKSSKAGLPQSPTKSSTLLELPTKEMPTAETTGHVCAKHLHQSLSAVIRKSPKRRPVWYSVESSSSSESLASASAREYVQKVAKDFDDTLRAVAGNNSGNDTEEDVSSQILPTTATEDFVQPSKKLSRLRAIGHQIRFLRRLEQSIKRRDRLLKTLSDSCPEEDNNDDDDDDDEADQDTSRVTSPLLQPSSSKSRAIARLSRQKRLIMYPGERHIRGRDTREKEIIHGDINSD